MPSGAKTNSWQPFTKCNRCFTRRLLNGRVGQTYNQIWETQKMTVRNNVKSIQDIMRQDAGVDGDAQRIGQLCWMFFLKIIDDQDKELEITKDNYRSPIPKKYQWRTWAANPE